MYRAGATPIVMIFTPNMTAMIRKAIDAIKLIAFINFRFIRTSKMPVHTQIKPINIHLILNVNKPPTLTQISITEQNIYL